MSVCKCEIDSSVQEWHKVRVFVCAAGRERADSPELIKQQLIGLDLQVAAARQDQEDLRVVDWQQHTARREDDHDDMEQINPLELRERGGAQDDINIKEQSLYSKR